MSKTCGRPMFIFLLFLFILCYAPTAWTRDSGLSVGEVLEYQVFAKGLPIGEQTLRTVREATYLNRPVLEVRMTMKSYAAYAFLFSYEEDTILYLDAQQLTPVYIKKTVKENDQTWQEEYHFSAETVEKQVIVPGKEPRISSYDTSPPLLEGLSLIYFLRARPWRQGQNKFYYFTNQGPQPVTFEHRGVERIRVLSDYQQAEVICDPVSQVTVWYSKDKHVYPLRVRVHRNFGVLTARLVKIGRQAAD